MEAVFSVTLTLILQDEGWWSQDPNDPGGQTICGIDRKDNPNSAVWPIVDAWKLRPGFPENMSGDQALMAEVTAFYQGMWNRLHFGDMNQDMANTLFEACNNQGEPWAIKALQNILEVQADGIMGQETISALQKYNPNSLLIEFNKMRVARYSWVALTNPTLRIYFWGWIKNCAVKV